MKEKNKRPSQIYTAESEKEKRFNFDPRGDPWMRLKGTGKAWTQQGGKWSWKRAVKIRYLHRERALGALKRGCQMPRGLQGQKVPKPERIFGITGRKNIR